MLSPFEERQMIEKSMNTGYDISEKRVLPDRRRSALKIMGSLIGLVKPLIHIMILAVLLGTAGYLCAIFLTILAGQILIQGLGHAAGTQGAMSQGLFAGMTPQNLFVLMIVLAVARGILHYAEPYCNHFIAFKLLAIIRHKVFAALRRLCPAKLEGRDKGNLISIITADIELLEVFYAHTISPAAIAALTSFMMVFFMGSYHVGAGIFALCAYLIVGIFIPLWNGSRGGNTGMEFRAKFGELNSYVLDSLRGLDETIQYGQGKNRERQMEEKSAELIKKQKKLSRMEGGQRSVTNLVILLASFGMLFFMLYLYGKQTVDLDGVVICTIAMMGSFGPVIALSNLSNNLNQTLASGERVLSVLEEKPQVEEIYEGEKDLHELGKEQENTFHKGSAQMLFAGAEASHVTFSYEEEEILRNYSVKIPAGKIVGIHGASGRG